MSLFRNKVRDAALGTVKAHFKLRGPGKMAEAEWLLDGQRYIFPSTGAVSCVLF